MNRYMRYRRNDNDPILKVKMVMRTGFFKTGGVTLCLHLFLVILFLVVASVAAQTQDRESTSPQLARGFRDIQLGMEYPAAEEAIAGDTAFTFRGRPDVSIALGDGEPTIDTNGRTFVRRGVFSFHQRRLFTFSLYLSTQRLDYLQLYNQLRGRYGEPDDLDPRRAIWEDDVTRITLERPLTVTFLDREAFEERRDADRRDEALEDIAREDFLELF